ncbi:hypothetical protein BDN72DRAFT_830615 [Pluteus cervinus]|uniref:Uncharacterized protein n=1 Tax=Pluteus cervinus TaxID=181527 RepID=A0ACD3BII8_9AGAR|nr:hypothetical protein BDN72DRAFT_830615 [Pluteus cervinus]
MNWNDSDPSDEDTNNELHPTASRKRSSRACDQCRKTKSKCERPAGDNVPCKSCALTGTACTFLGPSYKRGPPKGYIHAIEQRWHQVESLLGAVLQCPDPRVQSVIADLRQDDLAREILTRVDMGPYGPSGRRSQPVGATKEDFFASVLKSNGTPAPRDPSRSRRQSRVSREIVSSSQDHGLSIVPTQEWQDNLSAKLTTPQHASSRSYAVAGSSSGPLPQRRRLNDNGEMKPDWSSMYSMDPEEEQPDPAEGIGELSLDERQEVRYHGKASGLHLLSRSSRTDDRNEGGVWRLPMARVWPPAKHSLLTIPQEEEQNVDLPPRAVQDRLIDLYFTYVHPAFPVINKTRFLSEYKSRRAGSPAAQPPSDSRASPRPVTSQEVTPLLLLSMFALSARFSEDEMPPPPKGKMWEAGCNYLDIARNILTHNFHRSRPSTVQALLLMGYREFGIGSMEQGWIFIGMGIRMAMDLGLNCDSIRWKIHGQDLFAPEEIRTRKQIWWGCCLADRYGSVYMGRPIVIKDGDFDTPLPEIDPEEDSHHWQPIYTDLTYPPVQGKVSSCYRAVAELSIILGSIVTNIYPIKPIQHTSSTRSLLADLETRLDQWYISLPEGLTFDAASRRTIPPPHVLFLHIRYWGTVLLLNRAFIPNWRGTELGVQSPQGLKAFDLSQSAATHISSIVTIQRETFSLRRSSPFLTSYILSAAIMHILTLTLRPSNVQAALGLQQCKGALREMEIVWPSAARAWELLNGAKLGPGDVSTTLPQYSTDRHKRQADDAFGQEKLSDFLQREAFTGYDNNKGQGNPSSSGVQDLSTRLMAHMLGLAVPGVEASTSYYPGYEWWPRAQRDPAQSPSQTISPATSTPTNMGILSPPAAAGGYQPVEEWVPNTIGGEATTSYSYTTYNPYGPLQ